MIATMAPMMFSSVNLPVPSAVATTPPMSEPTTPRSSVISEAEVLLARA